MSPLRSFRTLILGAASCLALAGGGCGNGADVSPTEAPQIGGQVLPLSPAIVSEAIPEVSAREGLAFVSLAPGTAPDGQEATIRNPANGSKRVIPIVNGGWDPVAIAARSGDTLRVTIRTTGGENLEFVHPVPPRRPPAILRTEPAPGKRDVALNAVIMVVFSEPIDTSTIIAERVKLLQGGLPVPADIAFSTDGLRMTVRPRHLLVTSTAYTLVVSADLTDLSGEHLEHGAELEFSTGVAVKTEIASLTFVRGTSIFESVVNGSDPLMLIPDGTRPAWSPDGTQLAFTRPSDLSLATWQVCIAGANGSDTRCVTGTTDEIVQGGEVTGGPSWSPDGGQVAFSVFAHSCPGGNCGQLGGYFMRLLILNAVTMEVHEVATPRTRSASWSPDGRRIAIVIFDPPTYGGLAIVNADGSGLEILPDLNPYSPMDVAWSPDGTTLALRLWDRTVCPWFCDSAIGIADLRGLPLRILDKASTSSDEYFWTPPVWSPDGASLAYTISHGGDCYLHYVTCNDLRVVDVASGQVRPLLSPGAYPAWRPRLSEGVRR